MKYITSFVAEALELDEEDIRLVGEDCYLKNDGGLDELVKPKIFFKAGVKYRVIVFKGEESTADLKEKYNEYFGSYSSRVFKRSEGVTSFHDDGVTMYFLANATRKHEIKDGEIYTVVVLKNDA